MQNVDADWIDANVGGSKENHYLLLLVLKTSCLSYKCKYFMQNRIHAFSYTFLIATAVIAASGFALSVHHNICYSNIFNWPLFRVVVKTARGSERVNEINTWRLVGVGPAILVLTTKKQLVPISIVHVTVNLNMDFHFTKQILMWN